MDVQNLRQAPGAFPVDISTCTAIALFRVARGHDSEGARATPLADNLLSAVRAIANTSDGNIKDLAGLVVEKWRARLALHLRVQFALTQYP
ncbi:hypothetical protein [Pseudomonas sp. Z6-14]|uniref:hypothetical protein n=1 Tax=unclassified Pseudomonas TaxID=196821 RepID=UPI003DA9BEF8